MSSRIVTTHSSTDSKYIEASAQVVPSDDRHIECHPVDRVGDLNNLTAADW